MDEIVYTREALKRRLLGAVEAIDKAAEEYNPEDDFPTEEFVVALTVTGLQAPVKDYADAVADRVKTRGDARKAAGK